MVAGVIGILASTGNKGVLVWLSRLRGSPEFCGKGDVDFAVAKELNADVIGFLDIPDICYSPVMKNSSGEYVSRNLLGKDFVPGEFFVSSSKSALRLREISKSDERDIPDLTIINGGTARRSRKFMRNGFTQLLGVKQKCNQKCVKLYEKDGVHTFIPRCVLDLEIGDGAVLSYRDKKSFVEGFRILSPGMLQVNEKHRVILLQCKTDITVVCVLLEECGG